MEKKIAPFTNDIRETEFFSQEERRQLIETVFAAKADWLQRPGYFTLGAAAYIDREENYLPLAENTNKILLKHFKQSFYDTLKAKLEERFPGNEFRYLSEAALPGFHIFPGKHDDFPYHIDTNQHFVPWPQPEKIDLKKMGSMTFPLKLPKTGGGLYSWPDWSSDKMSPETLNNFYRQSQISQGTLAPISKRVETHYKEGFVYSFGGVLHQVMREPQINADVDDIRITLQAHAVWHRDGFWILFW